MKRPRMGSRRAYPRRVAGAWAVNGTGSGMELNLIRQVRLFAEIAVLILVYRSTSSDIVWFTHVFMTSC